MNTQQILERKIKAYQIQLEKIKRSSNQIETSNSFVETKPRKYITLEEITTLLNAFKHVGNYMHYTFFFLLAHTGIRKSEALALTWDDIDFENVKLTISKSIKPYGFNKFYENFYHDDFSRSVTLDCPALEILSIWKSMQENELLTKGIQPERKQLIFANLKNQHIAPGKVTSWLNRIKRNYDVDKNLTTHSLRYTYAIHQLNYGVEIETISKALGSNVSENAHYYFK